MTLSDLEKLLMMLVIITSITFGVLLWSLCR